MTAVVDMTAGMAVVVDTAAVDRAAGMAVVADKAAAGTVPAHHFDCLCQINCCCPSISPSDISLINMKRITDIIISQDNTFVQQILTKNFSNNSKIHCFPILVQKFYAKYYFYNKPVAVHPGKNGTSGTDRFPMWLRIQCLTTGLCF